ncbi:MAG: phospholipase C [Janthinobacterium lividum]
MNYSCRKNLLRLVFGLAASLPLTAYAASPAVQPDTAVSRFKVSREPKLTAKQQTALLRSKVKYIFVLYQENRSFDSYFGTFPGAEGLFSKPASQTPGFSQVLINTNGTKTTIHPFRIGPAQFASDLDDIDHSHSRIVAKMDIVGGRPQMDQFAVTEELKYSPTGSPSLKAKQFGELAMAYEDGDTIPFLWRYANRFVLFDHIFQQMTGPSTPGNLAIIGAQTGATQWMLHPDLGYPDNGNSKPGFPMLNDNAPFWGSPSDKTAAANRLPVNPEDFPSYGVQDNLTYATLPLTLAGKMLAQVTKSDLDPKGDLDDVAEDVVGITKSGKAAVPWGWYEEGYDKEPTDSADPEDASGLHASYITHHNGPQYFGYIANNAKMNAHLHGLKDFSTTLDKQTLPAQGGVFYVKGGYQNILGLHPAGPDPKVQASFKGDDDHPGYSDSQISEAQIAETVNKIAASKYWKNCAIIITWDDSEGDYDHLPPTIQSVGPDGSPTSDGPRVPLILISPYAKVSAIAHEQGDHASVVKFVDTLFGLTPLADLPDELKGRQIGERRGLKNQGPFDDLTPHVTNLLSAFDPARLAGTAPLLPPAYAEVPEKMVRTLPQISGYGWHQIGVVPTDYRQGIKNEIPADFNPRPKTLPTK